MLVLLNKEVINVIDPVKVLKEAGVNVARTRISQTQIIHWGQEAAFAAGDLANANENVKLTLAAYFCAFSEANCALFLVPQGAKSPRQVAVKLAAAELTTLAWLKSLQDSGRLGAAVVNKTVWQVAGSNAAA